MLACGDARYFVSSATWGSCLRARRAHSSFVYSSLLVDSCFCCWRQLIELLLEVTRAKFFCCAFVRSFFSRDLTWLGPRCCCCCASYQRARLSSCARLSVDGDALPCRRIKAVCPVMLDSYFLADFQLARITERAIAKPDGCNTFFLLVTWHSLYLLGWFEWQSEKWYKCNGVWWTLRVIWWNNPKKDFQWYLLVKNCEHFGEQ